MSIQIIDNFDLKSSKPIDNRFVVGPQSFYTHRDLIDWKYPGMRIWDLNEGVNGLPFVWTGTTYSSENTVSISGSGTSNRIPKFITSNSLGDSIIYDDGTNVGVGNTTPVYKLDVTGTIRATGDLRGNGQFITTINADNITTGILLLSRLQNSANSNWILTSGVGGPGQSSWVNSSSIVVGQATQLQNMRTLWGQNFNGSGNVFGDITGAGTIQFGTQTNKATLTYTTNASRTLTVPSLSGNRTFAFLEQQQTFTATQSVSSGGSLRVFSVNKPGIIHGWLTNINNFETLASSTSTQVNLYNPSTTNRTRITQYDTYFELNSSNRLYFTVTDTGARDFRFGRDGSGNQVIFYMDNAIGNVDNFTGKGVYIKYNLRVDGRFSVGTVTGTGVALYRNATDGSLTVTSSDIRLKKDIQVIDNSLDKVTRLRGVYFNWKEQSGFTDERQIGLIAQEVEEILPEAVQFNGVMDYKTVKYSELTSLLINAIKEQQEIIEDLKIRVDNLES